MEMMPQINTDLNNEQEIGQEGALTSTEIETEVKIKKKYVRNPQLEKIYLSDEDLLLPGKNLANKYKVSLTAAYNAKKVGYTTKNNLDYIGIKKSVKLKNEIKEKNIVLSLPKTQYDFFSGNYSVDEIIDDNRLDKWEKKYNIDGLQITAPELIINKKLHDLKAKRNEFNKLEIWDSEKNKYVPFSPQQFTTLANIAIYAYPRVNGKVKNLSLSPSVGGGRAFAQYFCKNLLKKNILSLEDFSILGDAHKDAVWGSKERSFKKGLNEFVLTGEAGAAMYYIGRDKITGTDTIINPHTMSVVQLDVNTFAIVEKSAIGAYGEKKNILYTFNAVTAEERKALRENFLNRGGKYVKESDITINLRVPMEGRIKKYTNTAEHTDLDFVVNTVRNLAAEYSIPVLKLSWKEQVQIASMISTLSRDKKEKLELFLKNYNVNGLRTFLSLEHGGKEMGDSILALGERFRDEPDVAQKIFSKYAEIIDSAERIIENVALHFKKEIALSSESIEKIKDSLYRRGAALLIRFDKEKDMVPEDVLRELESIHTDTIATLSVFKQVLRSGSSCSLEEIAEASFKKSSAETFSAQEVEEMVSIYQNNWKAFEPQEVIQEVIRKFEESFDAEHAKDNEVYTFTHKGNINAFVKFATLQGSVKYASALNVDTTLQGLSLGEAMMDEALTKEAQTSVLCALCESNKESAMRYFEKGFIATGFSPETPPFLDIWWNEQANALLESKQRSVDDLVSTYLKNEVSPALVMKKEDTLEALHNSFPEGKCLTRCFKNPVGQGWYAVYEAVPANYQSGAKGYSAS